MTEYLLNCEWTRIKRGIFNGCPSFGQTSGKIVQASDKRGMSPCGVAEIALQCHQFIEVIMRSSKTVYIAKRVEQASSLPVSVVTGVKSGASTTVAYERDAIGNTVVATGTEYDLSFLN